LGDLFVDEIKIDIFGRVQAVGFRHFVKETADALKLKGFVRNTDEGSLEIVAQGERIGLQKFLKKVQQGPPLSNISGMSYFWRSPKNIYESFIIALEKGVIKDQSSGLFNLGKSILGIKEKVPKHIAIIPDGNRRWAKQNGLRPWKGHEKSADYEKTLQIMDQCKSLGVKYLTFWAFSTENWKRERKEIDKIFGLSVRLMKDYKKEFISRKIKFRHIGRKDRLPKDLVESITELEKATRENDDFNVQICLDYGGKDEIARAINKILKSGIKEINEDDLVNYLDSAGIPDPDLIIRTSGEQRISGFMPIQGAYAEYYFSDLNFPEFGPEELKKAVEEFGRRKRRFGN
jgi:undecaprenyl diphosphate synthase